jgi:hypothetical protein
VFHLRKAFYLEGRGNGSVVWSFIMLSARFIWGKFCMGNSMDRMCSIHLGDDVPTVKILVGKLTRKRPFGRPKIKWVNVKFYLKINRA